MNTAVQQFLDSFEALQEKDQHQAAVEVLRRISNGGTGDLPDEALIGAADELFRTLDAEEADHAQG